MLVCPAIIYGQLASTAPKSAACAGPSCCPCLAPCLWYWLLFGDFPVALAGSGAQCWAYFLAAGCQAAGGGLLGLPLRRVLRPRGLEEGELESCLISTVFSKCSLCQLANELDARGGWVNVLDTRVPGVQVMGRSSGDLPPAEPRSVEV